MWYMQVYKFGPLMFGTNVVKMYTGAQILTAQLQHEQLYVWALVNPDLPSIMRHLMVVPTGQAFDSTGLEWLATVQDPGARVVHVFGDSIKY